MKRNHLVLAVFLSISVIQPIISIAQENPDRGKEEPLVLEEVKVKAPTYAVTPADFPGTVNVITQEEIDRAQPQHVGDLLKSVPGIHYQDEDGRGFRPNIGIRGLVPFRSRQVLFLVDGIPIQPSVYGDPATYYNVPVQRVERVEIIKGGPSAVLYGPNTIGGVINYITKRPS
ncbi:MAG TPA: TonB-dependent receptor plug domain-containing protein [Candidatus Binatia bacterium]|nr:TonB-dependent receptor plug domain-containing protein [Candidatus Binatia bacterium]